MFLRAFRELLLILLLILYCFGYKLLPEAKSTRSASDLDRKPWTMRRFNLNYSVGVEEFKEKYENFLKSLFAEFVGIHILMFFGVGSCTQTQEMLPISLAFGFAVGLAVAVVGGVSGGHLNPAVSLGMLIVGRISLIRAICYIIVQIAGAILATCFVKLMTGGDIINGHTVILDSINVGQALGIEIFATAFLVLTIFGTIDINKDLKPVAPLYIGLAVVVNCLSMGKYTGVSMNPARTLGTAILAKNFSDHWVYWIGPLLGGTVASIIYVFILGADQDEKKADQEE